MWACRFQSGHSFRERESRRRQRRSSRRPMLQNLRRVSARENACLRRATATATAAAVRNAAGNQKPVAETRMTMQREEPVTVKRQTFAICLPNLGPSHAPRRRQGIPSKQKSTAAAKHKPRPARHPSRSETSLLLLFFALTVAILRSTFLPRSFCFELEVPLRSTSPTAPIGWLFVRLYLPVPVFGCICQQDSSQPVKIC